jgi:hypothetical protein
MQIVQGRLIVQMPNLVFNKQLTISSKQLTISFSFSALNMTLAATSS